MARKPRITVTERDTQTDLDVLLSDPRYKARLDNPNGQPSAPIGLVKKDWEARWFNAAIQTDHIWRNKRKGWDQVRPADVEDLEQIGGYSVSPEGFITRGERGQEILMMMPRAVRAAVLAAKTEHNNRSLAQPNALKNELANAAGDRFGDQAGSFVQTHVNLTENFERVQRVDEA